MGHSNEWERKQKAKVAGYVAADSGTLQSCPLHPGSLFRGNGSIETAQELARQRYAEGALYISYGSIQELLDYLKQVIEVNDRAGCEICGRIEAEKLGCASRALTGNSGATR